ncbi:hypothetical protein N1027_17895 [Herbiconiux sp. CPCC 205763]|uniref:Uncharacterized protein n=1 Tax=Herbiconiux aconitum TaxID=2970913 RepID=A0ABT2GUZ8_9MICO|nr:hypothetical protein [Herbiconiux aconitum]MCS5720008.1 hypothetical protein [Herbiconiux aconitum]
MNASHPSDGVGGHVQIEARMRDHTVKRSIDLRIVPPGDLFIGHQSASGTWQLPVCADGRSLDALTATDRFSVTRMRFSDNKNQVWTTDDRAVLRSDR